MTRRLLLSTLFPYTTLFRSRRERRRCHWRIRAAGSAGAKADDRRVRRGLRGWLPSARAGVLPLSEGCRRRLAHGGGLRVERSEEHTSELQSHVNLVCRLLLE